MSWAARGFALLFLCLLILKYWSLQHGWWLLPLSCLFIFHIKEELDNLLCIAVGIFHSQNDLSGKASSWPDEAPLGPTAITIPIRNEDVSQVFARVLEMYRSLQRTGKIQYFHFYILSDSDNASIWIQEEVAWATLCTEAGDTNRIFYKRRSNNINAKPGNIAHFLRGFGRHYQFMVLLDADSFISGNTFVEMSRVIASNPKVAILQMYSQYLFSETLFARFARWAKRFDNVALFSGIDWISPFRSAYYGHNAILRIKPFMAICGLPNLPACGPFGGKILSHDYVEADFLRNAGWVVWFRPELSGAYEEMPPSFSEHTKRANRWAMGDLQHIWLAFAVNLSWRSRIAAIARTWRVLIYPAYMLIFLLVMFSAQLHFESLATGMSLSNMLRWKQHCGATMIGAPILILLCSISIASRFLSILAAIRNGVRYHEFGNVLQIVASGFSVLLIGFLLETINCISRSLLIVSSLFGGSLRWDSQRRGESGITVSWYDVVRSYWMHTLSALVVTIGILWLYPSRIYFAIPFLLGPLLSIPLTVVSSSKQFGLLFKKKGLFLASDETKSNNEIRSLLERLRFAKNSESGNPLYNVKHGWLEAIYDQDVAALHDLLVSRRNASPIKQNELRFLCERLAKDGLATLTEKEKMRLLQDRDSLCWLRNCSAIQAFRENLLLVYQRRANCPGV